LNSLALQLENLKVLHENAIEKGFSLETIDGILKSKNEKR